MKTIAFALLMLAACGGRPLELDTQLDETDWVAQAASACADGLSFHGGAFSAFHGCHLADGTFAVSAETGGYTVYGETLYTFPAAASCRASVTSMAAPFSLSNGDDRLTLETPGKRSVLFRANPGPSSATPVYGCFSADGTFTPGAVSRL